LYFQHDGALSSIPGAHREAVLTVASRLDSLLTAADLFLLPATRMLVSSQHRKSIRNASSAEVLRTYTSLYEVGNVCKGVVQQGCGSGLIKYGSGSSMFAQSGSGSKLKQNFRRQFPSHIFLKSKFESNQIKNTGVFHKFFFQKVVSAILYLFSGKIFC
jgi:hypothetical protein